MPSCELWNALLSLCELNYRISSYKGGFFSESGIHFSNLQISQKNIPKNYPELEIQNSPPKHTAVVGGNFEF